MYYVCIVLNLIVNNNNKLMINVFLIIMICYWLQQIVWHWVEHKKYTYLYNRSIFTYLMTQLNFSLQLTELSIDLFLFKNFANSIFFITRFIWIQGGSPSMFTPFFLQKCSYSKSDFWQKILGNGFILYKIWGLYL